MIRAPGRLARLPLRTRLVTGFAITMLVVLVAAGVFVYWRVEYALDRQLDTELAGATASLAPLVTADGRLTDESGLTNDQSFQVLSSDGAVLNRGHAPKTALIDEAAVHAAQNRPLVQDIGALLTRDRPSYRAYATPLPDTRSGPAAVLVVATERSHRDEALRELLLQLGLAGVATLLVTTVVGDRLAHASLRPVEQYRKQAAEITAGASGVRLDVPPVRDDEITRLGHTLNDMLRALEEALKHERRFVNDASHELRTPLTLIRTRVQLALRRQRSRAELEHVLAEVEGDIARLSRLADELLAIGAAQVTRGGAPVDLAALTRSQVERRRTLAPARIASGGSDWLSVVTSGPVTVTIPRTQLEQLVVNLFDNAALHGRPPVSVRVDVAGGVGRLMISDSGDGMDAGMLVAAPQRFARAPHARARPGSGLGLALVEAIVAAAGGQLRLCSHGRHQRFGSMMAADCRHGPEMTVTVLLPQASSSSAVTGSD